VVKLGMIELQHTSEPNAQSEIATSLKSRLRRESIQIDRDRIQSSARFDAAAPGQDAAGLPQSTGPDEACWVRLMRGRRRSRPCCVVGAGG
jgi:hypothetical protein